MKIVTAGQMKMIEIDCEKYGVSLEQLMENAGRAVAQETRNILGELVNHNILILVGPGNNGGDGLVAARYLFDWGAGRVKILLCGKRPFEDINYVDVLKRGIHYRELEQDNNLNKFNEWLSEATVVLDALFGTGKSREIGSPYHEILNTVKSEKLKRIDLKLIALDIPSGMDSDSGRVDPATPYFDHTITLGFPKKGIFNLPAAEHAGRITISDIGIPGNFDQGSNTELMTSGLIRSYLPKRPLISHKGSFGRVLALTGSINYPGAAYLSCSGSIRAGAGLTTLAVAQSLLPLMAAKMSEVTYLPLPELAHGLASADALKVLSGHLSQYNVLLVGCGLGQSQSVKELEKALLLDPKIKLPHVVLDADGINNIADSSEWLTLFKTEAIFTPHAAEMSRLLGIPIAEIQNNRVEVCRQAAKKWNKVVVLKGAYTVVSAADGRVMVSPFANPGLATAGTGDVLAGIIAGMVAQGTPLFEAATTGVYLHGLAGERVANKLGNAGMLASDLLTEIPQAIKQLAEG
jgi:ADP-dependent NAD(P)H-hydrate dehydratase / NAD(P)H-hydrate epimerase